MTVPSGEIEAKRILRARAAALATPPPVQATGDYLDVVELVLAPETYAIEAALVREVTLLSRLTPLPSTPSFVRGIVNIRGEIVAVIDLERFFGLPERDPGDLDKLVVLHTRERVMGILADAVGMARIDLADIGPPPSTLSDDGRRCLKGVTPDCRIVLDGARLISDERLEFRA